MSLMDALENKYGRWMGRFDARVMLGWMDG